MAQEADRGRVSDARSGQATARSGGEEETSPRNLPPSRSAKPKIVILDWRRWTTSRRSPTPDREPRRSKPRKQPTATKKCAPNRHRVHRRNRPSPGAGGSLLDEELPSLAGGAEASMGPLDGLLLGCGLGRRAGRWQPAGPRGRKEEVSGGLFSRKQKAGKEEGGLGIVADADRRRRLAAAGDPGGALALGR